MKKIKSLYILFCSSFVLSLLVVACCRGTITITGVGTLTITNLVTDEIIEDSLSTEFMLSNKFDHELVEQAPPQQFLLTTAYATTCEYPIENPLDNNSFQVSLNRQLIVDQDLIGAGENILDHEKINGFYFDDIYNTFEVRFASDLLNQMTFENGMTTFTFEATGEDGTVYSNTLELYVDLD